MAFDSNKAWLFIFICIISCIWQDKARAQLNSKSADISLKPDLAEHFHISGGLSKLKKACIWKLCYLHVFKPQNHGL